MSTRSVIAIRNTSKDFDVIYCHWDGNPEHNGVLLRDQYNTLEKARELIALGDLSALAAPIDECVAYHRDQDEDWDDVKPGKVYDYRGVQNYGGGCAEFMYIWTAYDADEPVAGPGNWTCVDINSGSWRTVLLDNL